MKHFLTVKEVAELLQVHPVSVCRWVREGIIPATRIGKRLTRIKKTDVEKLLSERM